MKSQLEELLSAENTDLVTAIADAEKELQEVQAHEAHLRSLIRRAHIALGEPENERRMSLHQAMELVLSTSGPNGLTARALAEEIKHRGLYTRKDGSPAEANQVTARASNYPELFTRSGSSIVLRSSVETI